MSTPTIDTFCPSAYARALAVEVGEAGAEHVRLRLPFREQNANPGGALHGGCAASLAVIGARGLAAAALDVPVERLHAAMTDVCYLSAAIEEDVHADVRLLRKGKALCFVGADVVTDAGKDIAHATVVVRAAAGAHEVALPTADTATAGAGDPGPLAPFIEKVAFIAARGIRIEHMTGGRSRLRMPANDGNASQEGYLDEGAILALLDTTGAMASWAATGPGPYKASTPALHAEVFSPRVPMGELAGHGRVVHRDGEIFWSDVEIVTETGALCARGTVLYRIVTG